MLAIIILFVEFLVLLVFCYIAIQDFRSLKITNRAVISALGLFGLWTSLNGFVSFRGDMMLAVLLFCLGLLFWLCRLVGAGDAKFMFVCGAFTGIDYVEYFAFTLIISSFLLFVAVKMSEYMACTQISIIKRLKTFADTGRFPYGVPLATAAVFSFLLRSGSVLTWP